jgi:hypothetical protein
VILFATTETCPSFQVQTRYPQQDRGSAVRCFAFQRTDVGASTFADWLRGRGLLASGRRERVVDTRLPCSGRSYRKSQAGRLVPHDWADHWRKSMKHRTLAALLRVASKTSHLQPRSRPALTFEPTSRTEQYGAVAPSRARCNGMKGGAGSRPPDGTLPRHRRTPIADAWDQSPSRGRNPRKETAYWLS